MLTSSLYFVQFCSVGFFFLFPLQNGKGGVGGVGVFCCKLVRENVFWFVSTDLNVLDLHVLFCFCFIDARMLFEQ